MMRPGHVLFSAVQFIFVVMLFLLGGLFVGLQYAPSLKASLAAFILDDMTTLSWLGWAIIGCSLLLSMGFYVMYRGAYYHVQMNRTQISIDSHLVEELIQSYWKGKFPEKQFPIEVILREKNHIEVLAEMPEVELESQAVMLSEVELELGALLEHHLGHDRNWLMTVIAK